MASLRELQRSFAAALRDPAATCPVPPPANLADLSQQRAASLFAKRWSRHFRSSAGASATITSGSSRPLPPALSIAQRRPALGGRDFAGFLDDYLAGGEYHWLADLARIEWARAECSISRELPSLGVDSLTGYPSEALERLVFGLQPSLHLLASAYPVFTVWLTNQVENAPPVDQSLGSETGMIRIRHDFIDVRKLDPAAFSFISALSSGCTLGDAHDRRIPRTRAH